MQIKENLSGIPVSIFGLFFTFLLARLHQAYLKNFLLFNNCAVKMEEKFLDMDCRPMTEFATQRKNLYPDFKYTLFVHYAPFTLIGLAFLVTFGLSVLWCYF